MPLLLMPTIRSLPLFSKFRVFVRLFHQFLFEIGQNQIFRFPRLIKFFPNSSTSEHKTSFGALVTGATLAVPAALNRRPSAAQRSSRSYLFIHSFCQFQLPNNQIV
jgi:hypothetical protein